MQLFLRTEKLCLEAFSSKVRNLLFQAPSSLFVQPNSSETKQSILEQLGLYGSENSPEDLTIFNLQIGKSTKVCLE